MFKKYIVRKLKFIKFAKIKLFKIFINVITLNTFC